MSKKKVVYCEVEFLKDFLISPPVLESNEKSIELVEAWMSFFHFFCKSDIILNVTAKDFLEISKNNDWLKRLWKKSTESQCGLEFEKDSFPDITNLNGEEASVKELNAVFLTTKDKDECEAKARELGVFVFNPEMARQCNHLFCDSGTAFPNETARDWNFLKSLNGAVTYPQINISNSMLIIDNYILCDDIDIDYQNKFDCNLKPILQNLLPVKLSKGLVYDITFFVGTRSNEPNHYDAQYNFILTSIRQIRKELDFRLSIFIGKSGDGFHDRSIATNNVLINSGYGFGILRRGGTVGKPTSINMVFPFFQSKIAWCDDAYLNIMHVAKKITSRLHEKGINCWGSDDEENKIIKYYNPTKQRESVQPKIVMYGLEEKPSKGVIGWIDLSAIKDNRGRRHRQYH